MQKWKMRAIAHGVKALLPFQDSLRLVTRRLRPYATDPQNDIGLLGDSLRQIDALRKAGRPLAGATVIEIGTGWMPILPIMFRLCGARKVITVDQEKLLDVNQFQAALLYIRGNLEFVCKKIGISVDVCFDNICVDPRSLETTLERSFIDYRAPFNFASLPSHIADIIVSRTVLEHVPENTIHQFMNSSGRILVPNGFTCHTIDMSDHWEHLDKSVSRVNFLKYDGLLWRLTGLNPQNFQNRLRRYEYVKLMERSGFAVLSISGEANASALEALQTLPLCKRYRDTPHEELAVLVSTIVAQNVAESIDEIQMPQARPAKRVPATARASQRARERN